MSPPVDFTPLFTSLACTRTVEVIPTIEIVRSLPVKRLRTELVAAASKFLSFFYEI